MCRIFGWTIDRAQHAKPKVRNRLTVLAAVLSLSNDDRGGHSWGWYAPMNDVLTKGLGELSRHKASTLAHHAVIFAHTRYATTGEHTVENAHPWRFGDSIVGAHNGILDNHDELNRKYERKYSVDSQHIFGHLAENKPLKELEAYGAIEYAAPGQSAIHLGRFNSGQLSVCDLGIGAVWSSNAKHLRTALHLAGWPYDPWIVDEGRGYLASLEGLHFSGIDLPISKRTTYQPWWKGMRTVSTSTAKTTLPVVTGFQPHSANRWSRDNFCHECGRDCGCEFWVGDVDNNRLCWECGRDCPCY